MKLQKIILLFAIAQCGAAYAIVGRATCEDSKAVITNNSGIKVKVTVGMVSSYSPIRPQDIEPGAKATFNTDRGGLRTIKVDPRDTVGFRWGSAEQAPSFRGSNITVPDQDKCGQSNWIITKHDTGRFDGGYEGSRIIQLSIEPA